MIFRRNRDMPMDLNLSRLSRNLNDISKIHPPIKKNLKILPGNGNYKWEEVRLILLNHLILINNR